MIQALQSPDRSGRLHREEMVNLLSDLIREPSFSGHEKKSADLIQGFFESRGIKVLRTGNNVCVFNKHFNKLKNTILLCAHHDTEKPLKNSSHDPYDPVQKNESIFGLGSACSGGSLVALASAFLCFYTQEDLRQNLLFVAGAEGLSGGKNGILKILPKFKDIRGALVARPTNLQMVVAETGHLTLDCIATKPKDGTGDSDTAIDIALRDIFWLKTHPFAKTSDYLPPASITVTSIKAENKDSWESPASCTFVVHIKSNEMYNNEEILDVLNRNLKSKITPRTILHRATITAEDHELVRAAVDLDLKLTGSETPSEKSLLPFPSVKFGPGEMSKSQAEESISIPDIVRAEEIYTGLLEKILVSKETIRKVA